MSPPDLATIETGYTIAKTRIGSMTCLAPESALLSAEAVAALEASIATCIGAFQMHIVVDLSKVASIGSRALELMLTSNAKLIGLGGWLKLAYPNATMQDILIATGLAQQIQIFDGPDLWRPETNSEPRKLGQILVDEGHLTAAQIDEIAVLQNKTGKRMGSLLLEKKWVSEAVLTKALAGQLALPFISLRAGIYDPAIVRSIEPDMARQLGVLPLFRIGDTLTVAASDPHALHSFDEIRTITGYKVRCVLAAPQDIQRMLDDAYGGNLLPDFVQNAPEDLELIENQIPDDYTVVDEMAGASPVINLVNAVIQRAIKDGASDIHLEISRQRARIRLRIDGILYEIMSPPPDLHPAIVSRLKVMANLDIAERRLPQDGRIQVATQGRTVDLRFSSLPGIYGEKIVLRVLDKNQSILDIDKLGMNGDAVGLFKKMLGRSHGLILVTGPTGSGKTTSLYAALSHVKSIEKNIVTIEDPVEYQLDIINQNQVNTAVGLSFAKILKHVLRQDPDIIMLGEVRDRETAEIAVQAALTGHLVLTTLHTNDTLGAISRLVEMGVEPYLLSSALIGVMAQRLVRKICPSCKTTYTSPPELAAAYKWKGPGHLKLAKGRGCPSCYDSGFKGRLGIYELLEVDNQLQRMIVANASKQEMADYLTVKEHRDLFLDGMDQVFAGNTTPEEISRAVQAQ